ncbi:enolase C-terminal domain-like protein [Paraburkholderia strydomiana]|uniref:enolase C-terminal domain-like protein n=1 Tax=Paraburkholderia strydomiana TaxID=1245417 RepID=UPI001BEA2726|nr:enolase C-terminal domain-like protein [Paraburkholderia strydomiana]MBT2794686.1 mandelate racemase [Paraburkholderia strydomiana]
MGAYAGSVPLGPVRALAYSIPTDMPEADGTIAWTSTTLVVVEVEAGGKTGLGYTYASACVVPLIDQVLAKAIQQCDAFDVPGAWLAMQRSVRNLGREGLAATAISAVDCALWDLKAKLLELPLARLLGLQRDGVQIYGSGGFTTYTDDDLREQFSRWIAEDGCRWVKMKIGSDPAHDPHRVEVARGAIGEGGLFVDANGALDMKQAARLAAVFAEQRVSWFEEPVSSDDLEGLCRLRDLLPHDMEVAAGEYGYTADYFRRMLEARAVDVLQADASRCGGITGFMRTATLADAHHIALSAHCAPALHLHVACAVPGLRHQEWFHDHVRIEHMLFDGAPMPHEGVIVPDLSRPGCGLEFKYADAQQYRVH